MLVVKDKVFLHMPRCAGTSIRWSLFNMYEGKVQFSCEHCLYEWLPTRYRHLPVFATIRHPVDWYQSFYLYCKTRPKNPVMQVLWNKNFDTFVKNAASLPAFFIENPAKLEQFKEILVKYNMKKYIVWWISFFENIPEINPASFYGSLFMFYYIKIGLNNPFVKKYRLEDYDVLLSEQLPGAKKIVRNSVKIPKFTVLKETKELIYETHRHIYEGFGYEL